MLIIAHLLRRIEKRTQLRQCIRQSTQLFRICVIGNRKTAFVAAYRPMTNPFQRCDSIIQRQSSDVHVGKRQAATACSGSKKHKKHTEICFESEFLFESSILIVCLSID